MYNFSLLRFNIVVMNDNKNQTSNSIKDFQELVRTLDATLYKVDSKSVKDGTGTLTLIKNLIDHPGMKEKVGNDFYNFVIEELKQSDSNTKRTAPRPELSKIGHTVSGPGLYRVGRIISESTRNPNSRQKVKNILMYPTMKYDELIEVPIPNDKLNSLKKTLNTRRFAIKVIDDKVIGIHLENSYIETIEPCMKYYSYIVMSEIGEFIQSYNDSIDTNHPLVIPNPEEDHITIVSSDIVKNCGTKSVSNFVDEFTTKNYPAFSVKFDLVKTSISNDWSVFSRFYVFTVNSEYLNKFINEFNEKFKDKLKNPINPNLHSTFAIVPRSLKFF